MAVLSNSDVNQLQIELLEYVTDRGQKFCQKLQPLWLRMFGNDKEIIESRYNTIRACVTEIFDKMLEEEMDNFEDQKQTLESLIKTCYILQEELQLEIRVPDNIDIEDSNLYGQIKHLENYLAKFEELKKQRMKRLEHFLNIERECCSKLGEEPVFSLFKSVPSEEKLQEIHDYVKTLIEKKNKRCEIHSKIVSEIERLLEDLEIEDDINSEHRLLLENTDKTPITEQKLKNLERWNMQLSEKRDNEMKNVMCLKEQVLLLWNLLDIEADVKKSMLDKTGKGYGKQVQNFWLEELERCEHLKRKNIKVVIERLRKEIRDLWNDCHMDEQERSSFIDILDENYDETLLEVHEKELKRLRQYYNERKDIYSLANKWFALWNKRKLLENRSTNIDRLNNRGGQLLKEEKERKAVQKELPNVESKLEKLVRQFEKNSQCPFLYDGRPLMDIIGEYWERRREEKENEKESRKILQSRTPLKSSNAVVTPVSTRSVQKTAKVLISSENVMKKTPARRELKMPSSSKKTVRRRSRSHDPQTRNENVDPNQIKRLGDASLISYAGFQDYFENISRSLKSGMPLRSSMSPSKSSETVDLLKKETKCTLKSSSLKKTTIKKYPSSRNLRPMIY